MKIWLLIILSAVGIGCSSVHETSNQQVLARGADKDQWWAALPRRSWSRFEKIEQSQEWFEVYRVAGGVYAIYEPGQFEEVISYLIVGSTHALLFDTGLGIGDMHRLTRELTDRDVLVLNSHGHYDHIAGNHAFDRILGRDTDYTRTRSAGLAHESVSEFVSDGWIWKTTPQDFDAEDYRVPPYTIGQFVTDGERIFLGDRVLEVIFTPGHAPDAVCLLDRENRILFTGDTFYPAALYTHLEGSDFELYHKTARKLAGLYTHVDTLMPAHNEAGVEPLYLQRMVKAFDSIANGSAKYLLADGYREYQFVGFSVITD